jgi:mRNA interferase HigB
MNNGIFSNLAGLKRTFGSLDYVPPQFCVFNISGNKYRLITAIHFNRAKVFIRNILTHKEYDRRDWRE